MSGRIQEIAARMEAAGAKTWNTLHEYERKKARDEFDDALYEMKHSDPKAFTKFLDAVKSLRTLDDIKKQMGLSSAISNVEHSFQLPQEKLRERLLFQLEKAMGENFYFFSDELNKVALEVEGFFTENLMGAGIGGLIGALAGMLLPGSSLLWGAVGGLVGGGIENVAKGGLTEAQTERFANAMIPGRQTGFTIPYVSVIKTPTEPTEVTLLDPFLEAQQREATRKRILASSARARRARRIELS